MHHVHQPSDGSAAVVLGAPWVWLEADGERFPALIPAGPHGPGPVAVAAVRIRPPTARRLLAVQAAAQAAVFTALGAVPEQIVFHERALRRSRGAGPPVSCQLRLADDWFLLPVPGQTAALLAGQAAMEVELQRRGAYDTQAAAWTWAMSSSALLRIPAILAPEPTAYLYGDVQAPTEWRGRAVHVDHVRTTLYAWLERHWPAVEALAEHVERTGAADRSAITALLTAQDTRTLISLLERGDPMLEPTAYPASAVYAAAEWWTNLLRDHLSHHGDGRNDRPVAGEPRWRDRLVTARQFGTFHRVLCQEVTGAIERRTPRTWGGLASGWHRGVQAFSVGVDSFGPAPVLRTALEAAGLDYLALPVIGSQTWIGPDYAVVEWAGQVTCVLHGSGERTLDLLAESYPAEFRVG